LVRVADYIVNQLYAKDVKHIFMVTGRGSLFLSDAVAAHKEVAGISVHHEQSAAFAAVAYAQSNETLGACLVSTGCAMTNAITGVLNAWQDGIPCVFLSGQNKLKETSRYTGIPIRTYGQQETDIIRIVESITKYAVMLTDPNKVVYEVEKALYLAQTGKKGPVWVDIPLDIQNMRIEPCRLERFNISSDINNSPAQEDIEYIVNALQQSERPSILLGSGIRSAGAIKDLSNFLNKCPIPVTYSGSAPDIYGTKYDLSIGSVGIMGCSRAGNFTIQNSDLILVLGNRLCSMTTGNEFEKFAREAKIIVVDIDPIEHAKKGVAIDRLVISDVKAFIRVLMKENIQSATQAWISKCMHWKRIFPKCEDRHRATQKIDLYYLAETLSEILPDDARFISDSGLTELILPTNIAFKDHQRCIHPALQGSMGFALPAMIGAHYAGACPIIGVLGDGSIMMNLQELETIRYKNIPAKLFIVNNNAYAVIRRRQKELFRTRTIGTDPDNGISCPDFEKIAAAFELPYTKIDKKNNLKKKMKRVICRDGPVICEIMGLEDQDFISIHHVRTMEKRFVQRPLEDQKPFLDRDLFLNEMTIKPIDQ